MSSKRIAISARNLTKTYTIAKRRESTLAETLLAKLRRPLSDKDVTQVHSINDLSFDIEQGQIVGLVGRNGAGKSTLLKVLSRVTEPTAGEFTIHGRIGSLIEVGTGFQPELTGRQNVFLNGAILGMGRDEIRRRFDEIVEFSGVEKFLETPVKRYSSGMYIRLAFAVAVHLDTEILLVDEALAVGDSAFQARALKKMDAVAKSGRTILFVNHNTATLKSLCSSAMLLQSGKLQVFGDVDTVIDAYHNVKDAADPAAAAAAGSGIAVDLTDREGKTRRAFDAGEDIVFELTIPPGEIAPGVQCSIGVLDMSGRLHLGLQSKPGDLTPPDSRHPYQLRCAIRNSPLAPGEYKVQVGLLTPDGQWAVHNTNIQFTVVFDDFSFMGNQVGTCFARAEWEDA